MADYKPSDLLVGIVDFFAILLPGAALTFVGMKYQGKLFNGAILPPLGDTVSKWIAFVLLSYLIGHFVFLIGSSIIDPIYGSSYRNYKGQTTGDLLHERAEELKTEILGKHSKIENGYKWSRGMVRLKNASAAAEIDRLEANSKFFRSLVVVIFIAMLNLGSIGALALNILILALLYLRIANLNWLGNSPEAKLHERPPQLLQSVAEKVQAWKRITLIIQLGMVIGLISGVLAWPSIWMPQAVCLALLLLSFWCYADQRWKMTQTAYLYFVILSSLPPETKPAAD